MKLIDLTLTEFVSVLSSSKPAPGGGSASALAADMGVALSQMVAELTIGKKKYVEHHDLINSILPQIVDIQDKLLKAIDEDTLAFNAVSSVFTMPKESNEEKEARKEAMQVALKGAALSPFIMMESILKGLELIQLMVGKTNSNAISDLGVAALNLKSGLQGAWLNVLINLSGIKDEEFIKKHEEQGASLVQKGTVLADSIYQDVLTIIK